MFSQTIAWLRILHIQKPQIASAVGQSEPDFSLVDQDKKPFQLHDLHGKRVLLIFYRSYWCPYCAAQLKDLANHNAEFDKLNIQIVAISVDDPDHAKQGWLKVVNRQFPVLCDNGAQVIRKYGIVHDLGDDGQIALRTTLLIDEHGLEKWRQVSRSVEDIPRAEDVLNRIRKEQ